MSDEAQPESQPDDQAESQEEKSDARPRRGLLGWIVPSGKRVHWAILRTAIIIALLVVFRYHVLSWLAGGHNYVWKKVTGSSTNHPGDVDFLLRLRGPGVRMLIRIGEAQVLGNVSDPRLRPVLEDIAANHSDPEARRFAEQGLLLMEGARAVEEARSNLKAPEPKARIRAAQILADSGGKTELAALREALKAESDEQVREQIQRAIDVIAGIRRPVPKSNR